MAEVNGNERTYSCWGCEYFKALQPDVNTSGECMFHPPVVQMDQTGTGATIISPSPLPEIFKAETKWCANWIRNRGAVPDMPGDPS